MGLIKRFQKELVAEWRAQCVGYKTLQRMAEVLVGHVPGQEFEAAQRSFLSRATLDMQQVENIYLQQERRICLTAHNLSSMIGSLCEGIYERIKEDEMTTDAAQVSLKSLQDALAVVATFLARVDALRTFAVLNVLAIHKILRRNCDATTRVALHNKLKQYPWHMQGRLAGLLSEVEDDCVQLHECLEAISVCLTRRRTSSIAHVIEVEDALEVCSNEFLAADDCEAGNELHVICDGHNTSTVNGGHSRDGCQISTDPNNSKWCSDGEIAIGADMHLVVYTHNPWVPAGKDVHLTCGLCAQRAVNMVEVGPHKCCWQCVAEQYDKDFIAVCGKSYDARTIAPVRALDRFAKFFSEFLPASLQGICSMSLPQQLSLLGDFVRTLQGTVLCSILLHPQPRVPVLSYTQLPANIKSDIPRIRILVADDDLSQRLLLKKMLSGIAYECEVVENGALAIERTAQVTYDLVLMDGFMPVKDGWQASREICLREKKRNRSTLIIGVTGATDGDSMKTCRDSGMRDVVPKPINKKFLLDKIRQWISESQTVKARLKTCQAKTDLAALAQGLDC